jgi:hypothetical protein
MPERTLKVRYPCSTAFIALWRELLMLCEYLSAGYQLDKSAQGHFIAKPPADSANSWPWDIPSASG